ncbi:T9SS type A sorting domain-containing protein [Taibaiella lutea]|uniref:T9SS type A sorting domain-containing protein n=1 Tax=Taibaiella lutea TaxID=2608001 RepID=A0A5M6CHY3_9BACT|nr:T9SS type A sorting domain-containing protein [Taibaiella lutea]KAA5533562.1 T9SS type A sorting domain-containing protein [Taibaiella lutea]
MIRTKTMKQRLFPHTIAKLLLTLLFAGLGLSSNAQITIGTGVDDDYYPIDLTYGHSRDITIYTASELNTLTTGGTITTLGWNNMLNTNVTTPLKIYLKEVGNTGSVTSDTWSNTISGATLVFDATSPAIVSGWNTIDIIDFTINSGQNLAVLVESNYGNGGLNPFATAVPTFGYTPAGSNTHGSLQTVNAPPTTQTLVLNNKRPDIMFGGLTPPSCAPPSALTASAITGTTANISFTAPATTPVSYDYYYSTVNTAPDGATVPSGNVTASPIGLNGLANSTTYYVWVRSRCGGTDISNWSVFTAFTTVQAPPANDECANATVVTVDSDLNCNSVMTANTLGATQSAQPAGGASYPMGINDDIWYEFTATATSHMISLTHESGPYGMVMSLYSGTCNALTFIKSDTADYYELMEATGLTIGNVYKLRVYTSFSDPGVYASYELCIGTTPPPPANDECSAAATLTMNTMPGCANTTMGTTDQATHSNETPPVNASYNASTDDDVWYQFTATGTTNRITLSGYTSSGMVMAVYSGVCGSLVNVQEAESQWGASELIMDLTGLTPNAIYKIRVFTYVSSGDATGFNICVGPPPPPPANDECATAETLTANANSFCNITKTGTTLSATHSNETTSPDQNAPGTDDDVWYTFTATDTGHRISLSGITPATDMEMAVYSGACGNLTFLTTGFGTSLNVTGLTVGQQYKVRVYTFDAGAGADFTICLGPLPPVNDEASGAITLTLNAGCTGAPYNNTNATQSSGEPYPSCKEDFAPTGYAGMWYKFVAPSSGMVKVSCDGGGTMGDSRMALFSALDPSDYSTFSIIACDDQNGVVSDKRSMFYATNLTAGTTYYINVDYLFDMFNPSDPFGTYCVTVDEMNASMLATTAGDCMNGQFITNPNTAYHGWMSLVDNDGKLIANIRPLSGSAASFRPATTIKTGMARTDFDGTPYLNRNYLIRATGTSGSTDVQFFFTDAELANLGSTLGNLNITKVSGNTCAPDFVYTPGTNTALLQTGSEQPVSGVNYIQVNTQGFSNFFIMPGSAPLPLELISFTGQSKGAINLLNWKTADEKGFSHFELQRSADGKQFSKLSIIAADRNNGGNYDYTDANPLKGKNFYRLNMVDANGKSSVSTVVELRSNEGSNMSVSLYPNPVNKLLKIVVDGNVDADAAIQVTDIVGKVVKTVAMSSNTAEIDMSGLSNGIYIIKYSNHEGSFKGKVIKN